jgi:hypothetical protein
MMMLLTGLPYYDLEKYDWWLTCDYYCCWLIEEKSGDCWWLLMVTTDDDDSVEVKEKWWYDMVMEGETDIVVLLLVWYWRLIPVIIDRSIITLFFDEVLFDCLKKLCLWLPVADCFDERWLLQYYLLWCISDYHLSDMTLLFTVQYDDISWLSCVNVYFSVLFLNHGSWRKNCDTMTWKVIWYWWCMLPDDVPTCGTLWLPVEKFLPTILGYRNWWWWW